MSVNFGENVYCVVVFDAIEDVEKFFVDGSLVSHAKISHDYWSSAEKFYQNNKENFDTVFLGVGEMGDHQYYHYANLECYACRLYSRPLSDIEVEESYKKTLSYHDFLEKN